MQDENLGPVMPVKGTAKRFHYLAITRAPKLLRPTTAVRVFSELIDMIKDTPDQLPRRGGVLQRDVVGNCIKVRQGGL